MNREHVRAALAAFWGDNKVNDGTIDAAVSAIGDGQVSSAEFRGFLVGFITAAKIFDRSPAPVVSHAGTLPDVFTRTATVFYVMDGSEPDVDVVVTFRKISGHCDGIWEYMFTSPSGERVRDGYRSVLLESRAYRDVYRTCGMIRRWV